MREFSTVDLVRKLGDVTRAATRAPVTITQHRKPRYVLMSVEDFAELGRKLKNPRKAYKLGEGPKEVEDALLDTIKDHLRRQPHDR